MRRTNDKDSSHHRESSLKTSNAHTSGVFAFKATHHTMITLRKLAPQSVLNFGYYRGETVASIMERNKSYLIWVYYNQSNISFTEDLRVQMGLTDFWAVDKPGTNPKLHLPFCKAHDIFIDHELIKAIQSSKSTYHEQSNAGYFRTQFTSAALRRRNHGKKTWQAKSQP